MKEYYFNDSNSDEIVDGNVEEIVYDIDGKHFEKLLSLAIKYCSYFSLNYRFPDLVSPLKELEKFEFNLNPDDDLMKKWWCFAHYFSEKTKFYSLNKDSVEVLRSISDSIFKFLAFQNSNPEDLTFYRSDNSVFFVSETHEGECYLYPRDYEDVRELIAYSEHWKELPIRFPENIIKWADGQCV